MGDVMLRAIRRKDRLHDSGYPGQTEVISSLEEWTLTRPVTILCDESFPVLEEEPLPHGYNPGDIVL